MRQALITFSILLFALFSSTLAAQQQWWFDVEVIIFKRAQSGSALAEKFAPASTIDTTQGIDLIGAFLNPDVSWLINGLPYCFEPDEQDQTFGLNEALALKKEQALAEVAQFEALFGFAPADTSEFNNHEKAVEEQFAKLQPWFDSAVLPTPQQEWEHPNNFPCVYRGERAWISTPLTPSWQVKSDIASVPTTLNAPERQFNGQNRLLAPSELALNQLTQSIARQSDLTVLSHLGWRQQVVFGDDKAQPIRLFAGQNFTPYYDSNGRLKDTDASNTSVLEDVTTSAPSLLEQVEAILQGDTPTVPTIDTESSPSSLAPSSDNQSPLWELDGLFKVYLRLLGQTPYLHVDSQLVFRQEDLVSEHGQTETQLYSYDFNQLRRVISKQVHYFDHPLFGIVVELRRYHPPQSN